MSYQHIDDEIVYTFEYSEQKNTIYIRIINKLLCEEYAMCFDNSDIFKNHKIICTPKILFDIFVDHFEKDDERIKIIFDSNEHSLIDLDNGKKYVIAIDLNLDYITDSITIQLPFIDKHITPQQVIERIDYRFDEYIPTVNEKISDLNEKIDKLKNFMIEQSRVASERIPLETQCKQLIEQNKILADKLQSVHDEFIEYVDNTQLFHCTSRDAPPQKADTMRTIAISCDTNVTHVETGTNYHMYSYKMLKYLKNLIEITFSQCSFDDLTFLAVSDSLTSIVIVGNSTMSSIKYLTKFANIENIEIRTVCNIKDLHTLVDCPELKTLSLPTGTNTGCFPTTINFKITMV